MRIRRVYQEGGANLLVEVYKEKGGIFVAEIIASEQTEE